MTAQTVSTAPATCFKRYSLTTFECILRESTFDVAVKAEADGSPAVGDTRWLCEAAAAMGTENKDRNRGDARLKVEANTLAACAISRADQIGRAGVGCGRCDVEQQNTVF
jgi:hypothetical protein